MTRLAISSTSRGMVQAAIKVAHGQEQGGRNSVRENDRKASHVQRPPPLLKARYSKCIAMRDVCRVTRAETDRA